MFTLKLQRSETRVSVKRCIQDTLSSRACAWPSGCRVRARAKESCIRSNVVICCLTSRDSLLSNGSQALGQCIKKIQVQPNRKNSRARIHKTT